MKSKLAILSIAAACLALISCETAGPATQIATYYGVTKLIENSSEAKKPERIEALRTAAGVLDELSTGIVSKETVNAALVPLLPDTDAELKLLRMSIVAYFPAGGVAIGNQARWAAAAHEFAVNIRAALPPV